MANPRKFSEKIALLNQKEAEGNAAYDAIIKEVSATTRAVQQQKLQKQATTTSHFFLTQPQIGTYRGGSLPNVNQMSNNSVDLQSALDSLQTMKQATGRPSLMMERMQRERGRQLQTVRRPPAFDKRTECSPYGSAYLSPPPDSNWRRVHSDSAIHSTAMGQTVSIFPVQDVSTTQKVVEIVPVPSSVTLDGNQVWELRKRGVEELRPKSCDVPGINIFPSQEPDTGVNIPIPNNSGSLPDLTSVQFPAPLATPIDTDDQSWSHLSGAGTDILSQALIQQQHDHIGAVRSNSPSARRRHPQGGPTPLVIHGNLVQVRQGVLPQASGISTSIDGTSLVSTLHPYANVSSSQRLQVVPGVYNGGLQPQHQHVGVSVSPVRTAEHRWSSSPSPTRVRNTHRQTGAAAIQYRSSQTDCPQSPTSPLSQPSYSPSESPGVSAPHLNTPLSLETLQQLQQQQMQTSELQQQFELINMLQESGRLANSAINTQQPQFVHQNSVSGTHTNQQFGNLVTFSNSSISDATLIAIANNLDFVTGSRNNNYYTAENHAAITQTLVQQQQQQQQPRLANQTSLQGISLNMSLLAAQQQQQQHQQQQLQQQHQQMMASNLHVPDIILTGADDVTGRADFIKDLGSAVLPDVFYDLFHDDVGKVSLDPLDFDSLQMLTDPSLVTDTETEDSFRLDRL